LDEFYDFGHSGHTSDQNNLIDFAFRDISILDAALAWFNSSLEELISKSFEFGSSKLIDEMLGSTCISSQEGKIDFSLS
jgi:hypothetical protein